MKILIACIHYPVASGRYLARALKRLGHDVRTLGPTTGNQIWGMTVEDRWAWQPDMLMNDQGQVIGTREGLAPDDGWLTDLVITADSAFYLKDAVHPHVVFGMDNHVRDYWPDVHEFDALFLAHSWGARMGEPNVHWSPPGYDPEAHTDLKLERDIDVMLLGYPYAERVALARAFGASGLRCSFGMGPLWDEYNRAYNRAKIALVRSVNKDLTQRFLENMAQGCCVLADRVPDAGKLGFVARVDYWPYATPDEAVHEARWLLKSDRWQAIAASGQRKVQGHEWDARAAKMLKTVATLSEERARQ